MLGMRGPVPLPRGAVPLPGGPVSRHQGPCFPHHMDIMCRAVINVVDMPPAQEYPQSNEVLCNLSLIAIATQHRKCNQHFNYLLAPLYVHLCYLL